MVSLSAISRSDVRRIAALARIALTEEEEASFEHDLSSVLAFVAELERADTTGVEPMTGATDAVNRVRPDTTLDTSLEGDSAALVEALPERRDGWAKVRSVF